MIDGNWLANLPDGFDLTTLSSDMGWAAAHPAWCPKCENINAMEKDVCKICGWDNRVVTCPTCNREVRAPDLYKGGYCFLCMRDARVENDRINDAMWEKQREQEHIHYDAKVILVGGEVQLDISESPTGFADDEAYTYPYISIEQARKLYKSLGKLLGEDNEEEKTL